jgi:FkbM family methyltransferase
MPGSTAVAQARRAMADTRAVCAVASPADASRWVISLLAHLPECARSGSLRAADRAWARSGASFTLPAGAVVSLPAESSAGAREMYCRNVYLRAGLFMPATGWVVDLGANRGLFSVWAAVNGAQVVAVEAQHGFAPLIAGLAWHNRVADRIRVEIALASGATVSGASTGVVADDDRWLATSHGAPERPADLSVPQILDRHGIDRIGLLKLDIEGGEFAVLAADEDLSWLERTDQIAMEVHRDFGDVPALARRLRDRGFAVMLCDNDGRAVPAVAPQACYLYGARR